MLKETELGGVTVRAMDPDDAEAVLGIAQVNGLTRWEWPKGAYGAVAELHGNVVAFCAVREILTGLVLDELWSQPDRNGLRGLGALAEWAEDLTAQLGASRGEDLYIGGVVANELVRHAAALEHRGYVKKATVYGKLIPRKIV